MAVIWGLSSDLGSAGNTGGIFAWLVHTLFPQASPDDVALAHGIVRKLGHLTEYAILAALWFRALRTGRHLEPGPSALAALTISVGWAITDELHQCLVPSRTASPVDVLIDATGAALAVLTLARKRAPALLRG
jgi:VanZ family protein